MDLAPFLLLTVVGGYQFASEFILSRYEIARAEGHRLYFEAIRYGLLLAIGFSVLLLVLGALLALALPPPGGGFEPLAYLRFVTLLSDSAAPSEEMVAQACVLSALFARLVARAISAIFLNYHGVRPFVEQAIQGNDLECLIFESWRQGEPIAITLDTGKFYVGTPVEMPNPSEPRKFLRILPMFSGHRDPQSSKVNLTTSYYELLYELSEDADDPDEEGEYAHLQPEDFELVIDAARIVSSNRFDYDVWKSFQRQPPRQVAATD